MKTEKAYKEAILRAHQSTEEANQAQEELLHMKEQTGAPQSQLNESPRNVLRSWYNLRSLDQDLAENRYSDLADDVSRTDRKSKRA